MAPRPKLKPISFMSLKSENHRRYRPSRRIARLGLTFTRYPTAPPKPGPLTEVPLREAVWNAPFAATYPETCGSTELSRASKDAILGQPQSSLARLPVTAAFCAIGKVLSATCHPYGPLGNDCPTKPALRARFI